MRATIYDHRCRQRRAKRAALAFITSSSDISISSVLRVRVPFATVYFLTLSHCRGRARGNVKRINATLTASRRTYENNRPLNANDSILNRRQSMPRRNSQKKSINGRNERQKPRQFFPRRNLRLNDCEQLNFLFVNCSYLIASLELYQPPLYQT